MNKTTLKQEVDFLNNQYFIDWVIFPTTESDQYWKNYIANNPLKKNDIEEAVLLIKRLGKNGKELDKQSVDLLWSNIDKRIKENNRLKVDVVWWIVAASFLLIIGLGVGFYQYMHIVSNSINYAEIVKETEVEGDVKLILSDNNMKLIKNEDPVVVYDNDGQINVDENDLIIEKSDSKSNRINQLNQLIVPAGKRSSLVLADGTKLWLNSGTHVIYPVTFNKREREIYIEGEAFLDVVHDENRPFYVVTKNLKVRVLGTKFNVSAYPDDNLTSVVLVEGSVQAIYKTKKYLMQESQLFAYGNKTNQTTINKVDVLRYISWKDGWMYCNNNKLDVILKKLSRYYNIDFQFSNNQLKELVIAGKLELKGDYNDVFKVLSYIAPVTFKVNNESILVLAK